MNQRSIDYVESLVTRQNVLYVSSERIFYEFDGANAQDIGNNHFRVCVSYVDESGVKRKIACPAQTQKGSDLLRDYFVKIYSQ